MWTGTEDCSQSRAGVGVMGTRAGMTGVPLDLAFVCWFPYKQYEIIQNLHLLCPPSICLLEVLSTHSRLIPLRASQAHRAAWTWKGKSGYTLPLTSSWCSSFYPAHTQACMLAKSLQSCLILCNRMGCSPPSSSVHRILQGKILEWVVMPSSRGSSWLRDQAWVSCLLHWYAGFLPLAPLGKPHTKA